MLSTPLNKTMAEQAQTINTEEIVKPAEKKEKRFFLFRKKEQAKPSPKVELREKQKKEAEELREKQKKEKEELIKKLQIEKEKGNTLKEKATKEELKNKYLVKEQIKKRKNEVWEVKKKDRWIEVITNENDPLYIQKAFVLNTKTEFLKIKNVELKYKLILHNQTPKIINTALIVWERKIPFVDTQTILKEVKISKPVIPYEERAVEYNETNSRREGEIYKVKIAKVIFEDGTQWKNPL